MTQHPHVAIYSPLPEGLPFRQFYLDTQITGLQHTTVLDGKGGGFGGANIGLIDPRRPQRWLLPKPVEVDGFYHVVITDGSYVCFEGRVRLFDRVGGDVRSFQADGYHAALDDNYISTMGSVADPGDSTAVLAQVLRNAAPLLMFSDNPENIIANGNLYHPVDFLGSTPTDVVSRLCGDGGTATVTTGKTGAAPWDCTVWENRKVSFKPRIAPPRWEDTRGNKVYFGARYHIDFDRTVTQWREDFSDVVSAVTVYYNGNTQSSPSFSTVTWADSTVTDRYNISKSIYLKVGLMSTAQATQYAKTYMSLHNRPTITAMITLEGGTGLKEHGRARRAPQLIRAGEWVQIGDQEPVIILNTTYNWTKKQFTAQCGYYPKSYWEALAKLETIVGNVTQAVNTVSGAPAATEVGNYSIPQVTGDGLSVAHHH